MVFKRFWLVCMLVLISLWLSFKLHANSDQEVVSWLYTNKLTKYPQIDQFRPEWTITRGEAAKFMVAFAILMDKPKIKSSSECQFSDISDYDPTLTEYIIASCEYGIFKGSNGKFFPKNSITKAEALAVVMRIGYGILDEKNTHPRYQSYHDKATQLNFNHMEYIDLISNNFEQPITRLHIAHWIFTLFDVSNAVLGLRNGRQEIYSLDDINRVLSGKWLSCEQAMSASTYQKITYECNDVSTYGDIQTFIKALFNGNYQQAADLMNTRSMIPLIFSSMNQAFAFVPHSRGVQWFYISWNGGVNINMVYITIENNSLHVYRSKYNASVGFAQWNDYEWERTSPLYMYRSDDSSYAPVWIQSCRKPNEYIAWKYTIDYSCIEQHLKNVMLWTSDDVETASRVKAMKQKILKAQK
jgi:hypothetical protein